MGHGGTQEASFMHLQKDLGSAKSVGRGGHVIGPPLLIHFFRRFRFCRSQCTNAKALRLVGTACHEGLLLQKSPRKILPKCPRTLQQPHYFINKKCTNTFSLHSAKNSLNLGFPIASSITACGLCPPPQIIDLYPLTFSDTQELYILHSSQCDTWHCQRLLDFLTETQVFLQLYRAFLILSGILIYPTNTQLDCSKRMLKFTLIFTLKVLLHVSV